MIPLIVERFEQISDGLYCTDYAGDVKNLLLNKPKPYRIVYDTENDIYAVGDATKYTHAELAEEIVKSGYIYDINKDFDSFISELERRFGKYNAPALYNMYMFHDSPQRMFGLFFIPNNDDYKKYEKTGFYNVETKITTGSVFVRNNKFFSDSGAFSDLYNLLYSYIVKGHSKKKLNHIWNKSRPNNDDIKEWVDNFVEDAGNEGYSNEEINEFLKYSEGHTLEDLYWKVETYSKRGLKSYDELLELMIQEAKAYGYTNNEIEDFLSSEST